MAKNAFPKNEKVSDTQFC